MIVATVQGNEKGGKHITVKDGKKISGKEQKKAIDELYDKVRYIEIKGDFGIEELKKSKEFFCYMEHPEVDASGRTGIAFIVWDKGASDDAIEKTMKEMGFRDEDYIKFKKEYNNKKKEELLELKKKRLILSVGLGIGLAASLIIMTLSIMKK